MSEKTNVASIIKHIRDREYMSGAERDVIRTKATAEVFTPTETSQHMLDLMEEESPDIFRDCTKTFLDPACGDGQLLGEFVIRRVENGASLEEALSTVYGVDIMGDNVKLCRERLACGRTDLNDLLENNIVEADGLSYHYLFDGTPPPKYTKIGEGSSPSMEKPQATLGDFF